MELYAFPSLTLIQYILVAEVDPYFSICLSRDFITKIGGHIVAYWSYMFFRTRYRTQDSLTTKPLSLNHIKTYNLIPININYTIREEEENTFHEPAT